MRELRQTIHRAVALGGGDRLTIEDFTRMEPHRLGGVGSHLDEWLTGRSWREIETEITRWALDRYGSVRRAAVALGRPPSTFADRVKHLRIDETRARKV